MPAILLPPASQAHRLFSELAVAADIVVIAGLPGVGKSLLIQQLAALARADGRPVQLAQWDVLRQAFETPRFPLAAGATHPLVISAAGLWLRGALAAWRADADNAGSLLICEAPLIGGRLMELARPAADAAEPLLRQRRTRFIVPVPSKELRALIEARRAQSIANPQHPKEAQDAPPALLRALWREAHAAGARLGLAAADAENSDYSPVLYAAVYSHLLRHRHQQSLCLSQPLPAAASVYEQPAGIGELRARRDEAQAFLTRLEAALSPEAALAAARDWYRV